MSYAELQVTSNFSFLRGASHAAELFARAAELGIAALGIADRASLAGIVRAHVAAKETGVKLIVGARVDCTDGGAFLLYPETRAAYARLCRLLTLGKSRAGKGACELAFEDVAAHGEGLVAVLVPDMADEALRGRMGAFRDAFGTRAYLALTLRRRPGDAARLAALEGLARATRLATIATNDVLYHVPERRILQDVLSAIRERTTVDALGFKRERFADRHLKPPAEMARLFARHPEAIARTAEIAERCRFSLDELSYQYPLEIQEPGLSAQETLEKRTWEGATRRYRGGLPDKVMAQIQHELALIQSLNYAPYFLTVDEIVRYARSQSILCQGRGSAANSAVCYVLGITSIDPERNDLLFERFVSQERGEPPDIDVDFEHERREEVIQWIYETYGRTRAALTSTVICYRSRGAVRDAGKALGFSEDVIGLLAKQVWGWSKEGVPEAHARELGLNLKDRRLQLLMALSRELIGFPRHLSQHPGGFVLTQDRLDELVPIEPAAMKNRQVIEWDKDDIDALRFMKVDVLGLGMLGCMRRAFDFLREHKRLDLDLASVPAEDPETYAMIQKADTIGTFQIESRAQMSMLPRLKPRTFYDLVIEVAIVRPGPIQGDMVHPYLRRRSGKEKVSYPTPELEAVLGKTLGVPLFQEQAMKVAIVCAGFSPGDADRLRRAMATFKHTGTVSSFYDKLVGGMVARGYEREFAERTFRQLEGFGSYGFPESHAASFALIAYASSWMKRHHPDVFCAALLNAQPMGFYAPAQIVRDALAHGLEVRAVDINHSRWDCTLEAPASIPNHTFNSSWPGLTRPSIAQRRVYSAHGRAPAGWPARGPAMTDEGESRSPHYAVRLGLRMVKGLANAHGAALIAARGTQPYRSIEEVWRRADVPAAALERLADADAFAELGLDRRQALWGVRALGAEPLPLFAAADRAAAAHEPEIIEAPVALPPMTLGHKVVEDYQSVGFSLRRHPVAFLRAELARARCSPTAALLKARDKSRIRVAGIVLVRQRPGTANGVMFMTIEDEAGIANLIIWPRLFERARRLILTTRMIACAGQVQREGDVIHVVAEKLEDLTPLLATISARGDPLETQAGRGDEAQHATSGDARDKAGALRRPRDIKVTARDFR
jgi:error-prone DNA polymerase